MTPSVAFPFRRLRRHPLALLLIGAALVVVLAAGMSFWAWSRFQAAKQALEQEDDVERARLYITQCLRVWHGAEPHLLAARCERMTGRFSAAEHHLNECIRRQNGPTEATEVEMLLIRAETDFDAEVEALLGKCLGAGRPESLWIAQALAQIYLRDSRLGSALRCLDRWLELQPKSARAYHWRGWVHERLNEHEKALSDYERALTIDPTRWGARLRLASLLLSHPGAGQARPHLDELQGTHPDDPTVQLLLAQSWANEGEEKQAIAQLDGLLAARPTFFEALHLRGQLALQREQPAEAETWLRKALKQRPADVAALYSLAQCLKKQGKKKDAADLFSRHQRAQADVQRLNDLLRYQVRRSPRNPDLLSEVGALLLRGGDEEAALAWLYRALAENPDHVPTHEVLLRHFEAHHQEAEAEKHRRYLQHLTLSSPTRPSGKD